MSDETETNDEEISGSNRVQARIRKLTQDKRDRDARIKELEEQINTLQQGAEKYQQIEASNAELQTKMQNLQTSFETDRAIMSHGILDDEGITAARMFYAKLGEDAPAISEWLAGDSLPKAVSVYLKKPETTPVVAVAEPQVQQVETRQVAPVDSNAGRKTQPQYEGKADIRMAATDAEFYKANRHLFVKPNGELA